MRSLALWRHELRRAGLAALLVPPVAAVVPLGAAVDGAIRLGQSTQDTAHLLHGLLEIGLPLAAGVGAASLVGVDPAAELQLTMPTAYRATILRRLVLATGWVGVIALVAAGSMVATGWWHRWPQAHPAFVGQLTWLAPTLFLAGLGLLAGAATTSPAAAVAIVAVVWVAELTAAGRWQGHLWSRLLYLFPSTFGASDVDWTANRMTLLTAGLAMTALAWRLLRRPARLLTKETE